MSLLPSPLFLVEVGAKFLVAVQPPAVPDKADAGRAVTAAV